MSVVCAASRFAHASHPRAGIGMVVLLILLLPSSLLAQSGQVVEFYHLDALALRHAPSSFGAAQGDPERGTIEHPSRRVGSVRAVSNQQGQIVSRHEFLPFGEEVTPATPQRENKLFTGKERDPETGLDYFGARYYEQKIGRFTTIDPVYTWKENLADPQRWNRYAYVRNNPLKFTDPDGRMIQWVIIAAAAAYAVLASPDIANAPGPLDPTYKSDQTGSLIANAAVGVGAGMTLKAAIEKVLSPGGNSSRGSTGRTAADNLKEQLAMEAVKADPEAGTPTEMKEPMKDERWPAEKGWVKMRQNVGGVEIHYVRNKKTGEVDDFKFKSK